MYIKTSCSAACNLSSGEKIAEQGADRVREKAHEQQLEQERLNIEQQRVDNVNATANPSAINLVNATQSVNSTQAVNSVQNVEPSQPISEQVINQRVNAYQAQDKSPFNTSAPNNVGTLINTKV
ncbi:MAG: hypothetical protein ACPGR2_02665 [Psychrobium sp.]